MTSMFKTYPYRARSLGSVHNFIKDMFATMDFRQEALSVEGQTLSYRRNVRLNPKAKVGSDTFHTALLAVAGGQKYQ